VSADPFTYAPCIGCGAEHRTVDLRHGRCAACDATFEAGRADAHRKLRHYAEQTRYVAETMGNPMWAAARLRAEAIDDALDAMGAEK
jgi:hypothetical protein